MFLVPSSCFLVTFIQHFVSPKNGMEGPQKMHQNFKISWGWPPRPPTYSPQNGMEESPKYTILRFKFQNFLGVAPRPPSNLPLQNVMEEAPKSTKMSDSLLNQAPTPAPKLSALCLTHYLLQENQDLLQAYLTWTTLLGMDPPYIWILEFSIFLTFLYTLHKGKIIGAAVS